MDLLTHLAMLNQYSNIVLNCQQQANYITAAWFLLPGYWHLIQHSGIGVFGIGDGLLILYSSLIKMSVYCLALVQSFQLDQFWLLVQPDHFLQPKLVRPDQRLKEFKFELHACHCNAL